VPSNLKPPAKPSSFHRRVKARLKEEFRKARVKPAKSRKNSSYQQNPKPQIQAENLSHCLYTAPKPQKEENRARMAKVFTIPVPPDLSRKKRERTTDPRYVDGQKILVEAMRYLAQSDPVANRGAVELLSEHVRTRFRMTDSPLN
jgi:hypothetical protein